jgi:hypothetical protein
MPGMLRRRAATPAMAGAFAGQMKPSIVASVLDVPERPPGAHDREGAFAICGRGKSVAPPPRRGVLDSTLPRSLCAAPFAAPPDEVGAVAQLVERLVRNEEVRGSTPLGSTIFLNENRWLQKARDTLRQSREQSIPNRYRGLDFRGYRGTGAGVRVAPVRHDQRRA